MGPSGRTATGGIFTDVLQLLGDPGRDVVDGLEMYAANGFGVYLAVEGNPGPLQDLGEELDLPLVERRETGRVYRFEHRLGGSVFEEHPAEVAVLREAVVASRGADYQAAVDDLVCC